MVMDWVLGGVNTTVPRNAGPECASYLDPTKQKIETVIVILVALVVFKWGYDRITLPRAAYDRKDTCGRRALLVLMSIIWGMEIGYKFSSKTVIYLLNPCHVTTAMQIYLLAAAPSNMVTTVFRIQLNFLNGPLLAFVFPETDTRILPLEASIYWIQHGLMFVVPYYLLRLGGVYNVEKYSDFSWNAMSYSLNIFYHFVVLQLIAVPTMVNLNHMLCPAILDPFQGPYYRVFAVLHQALLCPLLCKLYCFIAAYLLTKCWATKVKSTIQCEVEMPNTNGNVISRNSHGHSD